MLETVTADSIEVIDWIIRIAALIIVPFRRSASESRGWLLLFFIAPIPALLLYIVIGRPSHSKARKARFAEIPAIMARVAKQTGSASSQWHAKLDPEMEPTERLASALCHLPALTGNALTLKGNYQGYIDEIVEEIDNAKLHVHLEFYIFMADETGKKVLAALERAAARGVTCRVLIDALGSYGSASRVKKQLRAAGVEVHHILPLRRRWSSSRIDLRNHRKIVVIDGSAAYVGSQNIVNAETKPGWPNEELSVRMEGPIVSEVQAVFLADWFLETGDDLTQSHSFIAAESKGSISAQLLPTGPDYPGGSIDLLFVQMLHMATREIVITTPYFIPNDSLISAMRTAVLRGVKVSLILPHRSDSRIVGLAQRSYYSDLLAFGVQIVRYQKKFLHSKFVRVDDSIAVIGSSNMDLRSFELNAEISLIGYGNDLANDLKKVEKTYRKQCIVVDAAIWNDRPLYLKVSENCARLFSDLI